MGKKKKKSQKMQKEEIIISPVGLDAAAETMADETGAVLKPEAGTPGCAEEPVYNATGPEDAAAEPGACADNAAAEPGTCADNAAAEPGACADNAGAEPGACADNAAAEPGACADNAGAEPGTCTENAAAEPGACADNAAAEPGACTDNAAAEPGAFVGNAAAQPGAGPESGTEEPAADTSVKADAAAAQPGADPKAGAMEPAAETASGPQADAPEAAADSDASRPAAGEDAEDPKAQAEEDAAPDYSVAPEKTADETKAKREALAKKLVADEKELKNRKKAIKKMRQTEAVQRRNEKKSRVAARQVSFESSVKEMSADLKQMLSGDITAMNHRKKTRAAEIWTIFAKHNFYAGGFTPLEMRTTLEDLGPTYVKIGQIMSSRVDMLPESYCQELEKLRQNVKPLDSAIARAVIEQETGKKIDEVFREFNDDPLGSASIGQAHSGTLLNGDKVVVKVQRPLIADMMRSDFVLLKKIASTLNIIKEGNEDSGEQVDLMSVIEELEKVTNEELDFRVEAENTIFFKEHCIEDETKLSCPAIYPELTTERMMTMSFVDGYSISKKDRLVADGYDPDVIGEAILDNYVHQVLDVGTFHADPHQGNIMVMHGVPCWIDFGMVGRLTDANIQLIQDLILAIIESDTEALVNAVMSMGAASPKTDRAKLTEDLDAFIGRYMSVTNLDELDTAVLLGDLTELMATHYITVPGEYTMLIRSIATIEGVMEQLCPELNLFTLITDKLMARVQRSFDVQQSLLTAGREALSLGKKTARIPSLTADVLSNVAKGRAKVNLELTGYQELMNQFTVTIKNFTLALFACVIFFGSCHLCTTDIQPKTVSGMPLLALVGFIFSIALGIYTVRKMAKKPE